MILKTLLSGLIRKIASSSFLVQLIYIERHCESSPIFLNGHNETMTEMLNQVQHDVIY